MPNRKKGELESGVCAAAPAQRCLWALRDDVWLQNLNRLWVESKSISERAAIEALYASRVGAVEDLEGLHRRVFRLLIRHFSSLSCRPPTLAMVRRASLPIARMISVARDYRKGVSPKAEIKRFAERCRIADREQNATIAANAESELSFYAQDFLQQFSGLRVFPDFWFQLKEGRLYIGNDQLCHAADVAERALAATELKRKPSMPMHDELVRVVQYELSCITGSPGKSATNRVVETRPGFHEYRRTGVEHQLIQKLGELGGLNKLVSERSDNRMRVRRKPTVNLSTRRRPRITWTSR